MVLSVIVYVIGTFILARVVYAIFIIAKEIFFTKELDLLKRYGKGSWVLVTGATDGIGLEFAQQFAARGFNLILCSRSEQKLQSRKNEIQKVNPSIKVAILAIDFLEITDKTTAQKIENFLVNYDVSVLVNNVGLGLSRLGGEIALEEMQNLIKVNCISPTIMAKIFFEKVIKSRSPKSRSGLIEVSSMSQEIPMSQTEIYSATKKFNSHFARSMAPKVRSMVDVLLFKPGFVSTSYNQRKLNLITCTVEETVTSALKVLG